MPQNIDKQKNKLRFLYVPTHRDCSRALSQFLQEAAWAADQPNNKVVFCLIENNLNELVSKKHAEVLKTAATNIHVIHFQKAEQQSFIHDLLANQALKSYDTQQLQELLLPTGISYGRGPNLAYLLAESLGASSVHRRDSDITIDPKRLPIEMELAAIDRPFNTIQPPLKNSDPERYDNNTMVKIVGTGVCGDPTIDRRDLLAAGNKFLTAFQSLGRPGVDSGTVEHEAINYLITEPQTKYDNDFYRLDAGQIEMDAVCISDVYRYLPEMPTDILGNDYMVNDLNWHLHQPALLHSRKVRHTYDKDRTKYADSRATINYSLRDVQYIQIGRIWSQVGEQLERDRIYEQSNFDNQNYANTWQQYAQKNRPILAEVRLGAQQTYNAAAQATVGALSNRLQNVADALCETGEALDEHVLQAITNYTNLVKAWPNLMIAVKNYAMIASL